MIKGKPAYPFETIALAISFSPRMEALLCETKRLTSVLGSRVVLIHVGKCTPKKEQKLNALLVKHNFNTEKVTTIWEEGHPVETILKVCKEKVVDLLVAGALERESFFRHYVGSVSREICRKAKCSVLMLTEPSLNPSGFKKIVVSGVDNPKTIHTIGTVLYLARHDHAEEVTIVEELHTPAMAMGIADNLTDNEAEKVKDTIEDEADKKVNEMLQMLDTSGVKIKRRTLRGKPGYCISYFASNIKADLLVMNSPDTHLNLFDRIFTHDMEYVLAGLPCNLLIVHSRI